MTEIPSDIKQAIDDLKHNPLMLNYDRIISVWDDQVNNNRKYYGDEEMAHANNIENLLLQLKEECDAFLKSKGTVKSAGIRKQLDELENEFKRNYRN